MMGLQQAKPALTAKQKKEKRIEDEKEAKAVEDANRYRASKEAEKQQEVLKIKRERGEVERDNYRLRKLRKMDSAFSGTDVKHSPLFQSWRVKRGKGGKLLAPYLTQTKYDFLKSLAGGGDTVSEEFGRHLHDLYASNNLYAFEYIAYRAWPQFSEKADAFEP